MTKGKDCKEAFRAAYENRYTWDAQFCGYQGTCFLSNGKSSDEGSFTVGSDLKATVTGIKDEQIHKAITSQLWEVAIHRVRRSFDQTHGLNTFVVGSIDEIGMEVIVGGKNSGDRYKIKNDVITMVHRHIHDSVVTIFTKSIINTGNGYLSREYTSQYSNPITGKVIGPLSKFRDTFVPLIDSGAWVLSERIVEKESNQGTYPDHQIFRFEDLSPM